MVDEVYTTQHLWNNVTYCWQFQLYFHQASYLGITRQQDDIDATDDDCDGDDNND